MRFHDPFLYWASLTLKFGEAWEEVNQILAAREEWDRIESTNQSRPSLIPRLPLIHALQLNFRIPNCIRGSYWYISSPDDVVDEV